MKKAVLCFILVIVFLFAYAGAYADSDAETGTFFSTTLLKLLDYNAKEWMSTESNRAMLAACAFLDYSIQEEVPYNVYNMYSGTTFVGRSSFLLSIGYNEMDNDNSLIIVFDPRDNTQAAYATYPMNKTLLEYTLEKMCPDGYYKIDPVDLKEVNDMLQDALSN